MRTVLLILIAASALTDWWTRLPGERARSATIERIAKPLTTILVIVLAATADAPGVEIAMAVVALTCCLAGDVALMEPIDNFVAGLAAFLVGHLVFIALFVRFGLHHGALAVAAAGLGIAVGAVVGRPILLAVRRSDPSLVVPVAAYLVVIVSMLVFGWWTGRGWVIAGSTAFVVSDSVLGWQAFVTKRRYLPLMVMITYHASIVALALGV